MSAIQQGFRFGPFALDVRARELRKGGSRIRLQDQPFDVLLMLLLRPGEVVTRDELRCQLWPDGTFVDFEHGLNAAVKRLRAAIGDNADRPRFIETLPRRGYRFVEIVDSIGPVEPGRAGKKPRLAVLPFAELDPQNDQTYFSEGLTEEMIVQLGRRCADRLAVVSRFSSTLARRNAGDTRAISDVLHADYLLEGSVRRDSNRVRITARLVDAREMTHVWADTYERDLSDCFLVQAEVASRIAHALALELLPASGPVRGAGTCDPAAHQAYLKGRYHWNKQGAEGLLQAVSHYEEALTLDPEFALAHSALGRAHVAVADYYVREPRPALEAARAAALRALELDRTDSDAHLTLAEVHRAVDWNWMRAEDAYRLALSFNPSSEAAYRLYALSLAARRRPAEAAQAAERACELDPLCLVVNTSAAWVRYLDGDYGEALDRCHHTLGMDADFVPAHRLRAAALLQIDRAEEASAVLERILGWNDDPISLAWLINIAGSGRDRTRAAALMDRLHAAEAERYVSGYHLALAYMGLGEIENALSSLTTAGEGRDPAVMNLAAEPRFERLRADPRYRSLANGLGLP